MKLSRSMAGDEEPKLDCWARLKPIVEHMSDEKLTLVLEFAKFLRQLETANMDKLLSDLVNNIRLQDRSGT